jgi:hypothetical protein
VLWFPLSETNKEPVCLSMAIPYSQLINKEPVCLSMAIPYSQLNLALAPAPSLFPQYKIKIKYNKKYNKINEASEE